MAPGIHAPAHAKLARPFCRQAGYNLRTEVISGIAVEEKDSSME